MARIDVSNRVFTNVKTYINDVCKNVSSGEDKSKAEFPAVSVIQIDNADSSIDLENSENAVKSVIEIQCYSSDSITEAKKIANMCCDAMKKMGYVRTYGPQSITNAADTSLYRMVARFNRIVTSVGEIEKFETMGA